MRIDADHSAQPRSKSGCASIPNSQAAGPGVSGVNDTASQDHGQLSAARVQEQALAAEADQCQEVRAERVHALRLAVQEGNYGPSAENVAEAIVSYIRMEPPVQLRTRTGETPMGSGDLATDLSTERPQPPASVRAAPMHSFKEDTESQLRRRPPSEDGTSNDPLGGTPESRMDSLA